MGWFDTEIETVYYSDEALDMVYDFLSKFSEAYQNDLHRKPRVEELEYLLKLVFRTSADDTFLDDFSERRIEDVKLKIAKRKKKQDYAIGDIFSIPLPSGGYGFGRIIYLDQRMWYLSEIFAYYSKSNIYRPEIENAGHLLYPMIITPRSHFENWLYTIIHRDHDYVCPFLDELRYVSGSPGNYWVNKVGEYGKGPTISDEEAAKMHKYEISHPDDDAVYIEKKLKEKGLVTF